jgi:3-oxoacyl-[acyl-carrier protein] reductase|tara:strand:+ start:3643 stop:4356 length:714 start_codon:yes stop_codon:yes gene_type:complete
MSFNKLYIVVGASNGLGHEFAKHVSIKNKTIGIYNKTKREGNKNIIYLKVNIEYKKQIEKFFKEKMSFINKFKVITFINFATYKKDDLILNIKDKDIKKTFSINLFSNIFFIQNLIKNFYLKKLNIIFISSSLGKNVDAGTLLYSSSKISLESLMKSIVIEYSGFNVRCNTLVLGFFKSPLWNRLNDAKKDKITKLLPSKKIGKVSNILNTIKFIEKNDDINSSLIYLDSGFRSVKI